jgi:hypothetical protein
MALGSDNWRKSTWIDAPESARAMPWALKAHGMHAAIT